MSATPKPLTDEIAYEQIEAASAAPLWRFYGNLFPKEPAAEAVGHVWRYAEMRPILLHFAETLSLEDAERRVLMFANPSYPDPPRTLKTLFGGLQIILPNETAHAHRHSAGAFRFIVEGHGACTTVNGERIHMEPGDLLLTPSWHWHDHHHEFDGPMIWLDGLDWPLTNMLEGPFFEQYHEREQAVTEPDDISTRQFIHGQLRPNWEKPKTDASPIGNYPWKETLAAFDDIAEDAPGTDFDGIMLDYTNPWTGGPVMPTIGCRVQRLLPGFAGKTHRHTSNTIYHVMRGSGTTVVDGVELDWALNDTFCVPTWAVHDHRNGSASDDAILFSYSDEPVMKAVGLYREAPAEQPA